MTFKGEYNKDSVEERLARLEADVRVLGMRPDLRDIEVFRDPPRAETSYVGKKLSTIKDDKYLWRLADFLDYCASNDAKSEDEKKRKFAYMRRNDAARVRYFKAQLAAKPLPSKGGDGVPF